MLLNRQEGLTHETSEKVTRTMIAELNIPDHPTAHGSTQGKQFLRAALQVSHTMRVYEISFVAELMAQFIDGDEEIRYRWSAKSTRKFEITYLSSVFTPAVLLLSIDARVELNCACKVSNKRSLYEQEKTLACLFFCQAGMTEN